ncbi:hypothetical protein FXO38_33555 [Capsicum annuum]|nr:hypothetical protein FXO38_33555 [Capsicum annuum]
MPICFGLKEFDIVTGLRCDRPEESLTKETPRIRSKESKTAKPPPPSNRRKALSKTPPNGLLDFAGHSYKIVDLIEDLKDKTIPKQYRDKLCLVWFAYFVILVRDIKKVIEDDLLALADDFEKFNDYT